MTGSPLADSGVYNSIMDLNDTTQFQNTQDTNNELEIEIPEWLKCGFVSDNWAMFLIGGIGVSLVSLIGIIGNILCAIVLSRPLMRTSTNIILLGLSVCDLLFVFVAFLVYGIPWAIQFFCVDSFESFYLTTLFPIITTYIEPFLYTAQLGSTYFTLLVALERIFVVYRPLMARPYCTNKNAIRASLIIVAFTILFKMPEWWGYRIESVYSENGSWTKYRILLSLFGNANYVLYYRYVCMFVYRIIPVTLLTFLNISIYWKIREANKQRESMTQQVNSSEISIAKMLIWIVSIYLLSNVYDVYWYVRLIVGLEDTPELVTVSYFLLSLNSAINFIIYSFMAKKFRPVLLELFCLKKLRVRWGNNARRNSEGEIGTTDTQLSTTSSTTQV